MQNPKITKTTDITGFEIFVMKGKPCPKLKGLKKQSYMDVVLKDGMKITDNCDNSKKKHQKDLLLLYLPICHQF